MTPAPLPATPGSKPTLASSDVTSEFVFEYWQTSTAENARQEGCWRLRTLAGTIVAHNEGLADLGECLRSLRLLRHAMADDGVTNLVPRDC